MTSHTAPIRDVAAANFWAPQRMGAAVQVRRLELELSRDVLAARIEPALSLPPGALDRAATRDHTQTAAAGTRRSSGRRRPQR